MGHLSSQKVCAFVATRDRDAAKAFYSGTLGLTLRYEDEYAIVFDLAEATLRVTPVPNFVPHQHTALGWNVADVPATVKTLAAAGVTFERYGFLEQDELGIWRHGEVQVAWFKDPDGNILSLSSG